MRFRSPATTSGSPSAAELLPEADGPPQLRLREATVAQVRQVQVEQYDGLPEAVVMRSA